MADNSVLNAGSGGDTARTKDRAGIKTQIIGLDLNPSGSEVLGTGDALNGLDVDVTRLPQSATAALTNVAAAATTAVALAANAARTGMLFINDADKSCYLKYGATASATSFARKLMPGEQWEPAIPYTGRIDVIWDAAPTGALRVTELSV